LIYEEELLLNKEKERAVVFGYDTLGIAMGVLYIFVGQLLNPMFAAAAMSLSLV